jgi:hypothetical protein
MEMIEVGVSEQHHINARQVLDFQPGTPDPLQKKKPIRKIRIYQHVQIGELRQK